MKIALQKDSSIDVEKQAVEIVERKGLGHPDYIADSIAESFSRNLSKFYIKEFGSVLHHNVDKLEVIGGATEPAFGGGKIVKEISMLFSGRATSNVNGKDIPVKEIAINSAKEWIKGNLRFLDPERVNYLFYTGHGAANLKETFKRTDGPRSNDTSFAVGYYPLSRLENMVLSLERMVNSKDFKSKFPISGEDVKVMGVRIKNKVIFTVAMAFVDRFISSEKEYFSKKAEIVSEMEKYIAGLNEKLGAGSGKKLNIDLAVNSLDKKGIGANGCYLTVTGLSAEAGDDGAVGRGNRVNGLITPNRPMTLEAAAGKNPVNHIGKIYSLFSFDLSKKIYEQFGVKNQLRMVGRIGNDLSNPLIVSVKTDKKVDKDIKKNILTLVDDELSKIEGITNRIIEGKYEIC